MSKRKEVVETLTLNMSTRAVTETRQLERERRRRKAKGWRRHLRRVKQARGSV